MIKKITKSYFTLLVLSLFAGTAIGQVNMNRYITFSISKETSISLKADGNDTPIKIVSSWGDVEIIVGTEWKTLYFYPDQDTITIYGNICAFSNSVNGETAAYGGIYEIDLSNNIGLKWLNCSGGRYNDLYLDLTILDVSNLVNLETLICSNNRIGPTGIENLTNLKELWCTNSNISTLDISNLKKLEMLICRRNNIITLDVSNLENLKNLYCHENKIVSIKFSNLSTNLEILDCSINQITSLDVTELTNLKRLNCHTNKLATLDLSNLTDLELFYCDKNQFNSIDDVIGYSGLVNLKQFSCASCNTTSLDVSNLKKLEFLSLSNNPFGSLDAVNGIYELTNLKKLYCYGCNLTSLNVSSFSNLEELNFGNNTINSLDVVNGIYGLTNLKVLYCQNCNLNSIDASPFENLNLLCCYGNSFTTQALDDIYCSLPESGGNIFPAIDSQDPNIAIVLATNSKNARDKNWEVKYTTWDYSIGNYTDIPTTGTYECTTDINAMELESGIKVYPNPVSDLLNIDSEYSINDINIYDMSGKAVINRAVDLGNTTIDVSNLVGGTYILQILTDKGVVNYNFIKK